MEGETDRAETALREGYLYFLPKLARAYLLVLRAGSVTLGWDFSEKDWQRLAREHDLPVASTFARASGGGSFNFAKFLAGVGPLPPHRGGSRLTKGGKIEGWTNERLLLGAMTVARMNGGWPARGEFDNVARKARARGVDAPFFNMLRRRLRMNYSQVQDSATRLAEAISNSRPAERIHNPRTYDKADAVARAMALGVQLLGHRPSSETWDDETRHLRDRGVCSASTIHLTFGTWRDAWGHVKSLGLDPGIQSDPRPRYTAVELARGMALVERRLGYRPSASNWTDAVRELKRKVGPGVIPAKPTIYWRYPTWNEAWLFVDLLRTQRLL